MELIKAKGINNQNNKHQNKQHAQLVNNVWYYVHDFEYTYQFNVQGERQYTVLIHAWQFRSVHR
jgi:hypothetical protein